MFIPNSRSCAGMLSVAVLAAMAWTPAKAITISAESEYYENGSLVASQSSNSTPTAISSAGGDDGNANAHATTSGVFWTSAYAGTNATDPGDPGIPVAFALSFPAPSGDVTSIATSTWENTVTNNTGTQVEYKYLFHIYPTTIGTGGEDGDYAGVGIDITLNGASIWSAFAEMDGCTVGYSGTMGAPTTTGDCNAQWLSFTASVDLGTYVNGQTFTIGYEMTAFANTADVDRLSFARVGDPLDPDANPIIPAELVATPVSTTAVPVPGALGLLGVGLAGLGLMVRRRSRLAA